MAKTPRRTGSKPSTRRPAKGARSKASRSRARKTSPTEAGPDATDEAARPPTRGERRRLALLDGGVEIVAREGLSGLSVEALASAGGISNGALYRHFGSMDDALGALQVHALERVTGAMERSLWSLRQSLAAGRASKRTKALVELLATVEMILTLQVQDPGAIILLRSMAGDPGRRIGDEELSQSLPSATRLLGMIGGLFLNAADAGALKSGDDSARSAIWLSSLLGLLQLAKLEAFELGLDVDGLARDHAATLLIGYGASASSVATARRTLDDA